MIEEERKNREAESKDFFLKDICTDVHAREGFNPDQTERGNNFLKKILEK